MDAQEHVANLIVEADASARQCGGFINAVVVGLEDNHDKHAKVLNTKIDGLTTALAATKKENEALVAAKNEEDKKWKTKCNSLEGKLEEKREAFAKTAVEQAVAKAVEEKDEEIEALKHESKLLRELLRTSTGSTVSDEDEEKNATDGKSLDEDDDDNNHDNKRTTGKSEDSLGGDGDDNNHNNKSTTESSEDAFGGNDDGNESKTDNAVVVSDVESSDDHDNGDDGLATAEGGTGEQQTESENNGQVEQESPNEEEERKDYRKRLLQYKANITARVLAKQIDEGGTGEQQTESENTRQVEQESPDDEEERKDYRKRLLQYKTNITARVLAKQSN